MHFSPLLSLLPLLPGAASAIDTKQNKWLADDKPAGYAEALIFPYTSSTLEAISRPVRWIANSFYLRKPAIDAYNGPVPSTLTMIPSYANWTTDHWLVHVHGSAHIVNDLPTVKLDKLLNRVLIRAKVWPWSPWHSKPGKKFVDPDSKEYTSKHHKKHLLNSTELSLARRSVQAIANTAVKRMAIAVDFLDACKEPIPYQSPPLEDFTARDGAFSGSVALPPGCGPVPTDINVPSDIEFSNIGGHDDRYQDLPKTALSSFAYVPPNGLTILSDVDDVLRVAEIWNPKQAILNVLARPFQPWRNMPEVFEHWNRKVPGVHFHYSTDAPELDGKFYVEGVHKQ